MAKNTWVVSTDFFTFFHTDTDSKFLQPTCLTVCLFKVLVYGFYHGQLPCLTTIWGILLLFFTTTVCKQNFRPTLWHVRLFQSMLDSERMNSVKQMFFLPETNSKLAPENVGRNCPKNEAGSSCKHPFSGAGRVSLWTITPTVPPPDNWMDMIPSCSPPKKALIITFHILVV